MIEDLIKLEIMKDKIERERKKMTYEVKGDKIIIDKDDFTEESEIQYLNFILGYDLLKNMFKKSKCTECDISYDFSDYLSRKFIKSEEYQNTKYSTYEMLDKWINNNKSMIKKEYELFLGERDITPIRDNKKKDKER